MKAKTQIQMHLCYVLFKLNSSYIFSKTPDLMWMTCLIIYNVSCAESKYNSTISCITQKRPHMDQELRSKSQAHCGCLNVLTFCVPKVKATDKPEGCADLSLSFLLADTERNFQTYLKKNVHIVISSYHCL